MEATRRTVLGGLAAFALGPSAHAAPAASADPVLVRKLLLALHPGLTRYQSLASFEQRHARFAQRWAAAPSLEARYLSLSRLLADIRCGHSYVNPYNQRREVIARLTEGRDLLPFLFRWLPEGMVVTGDPHALGIAPGTIVHRIDAVSTRAMLAALLPYARADGSNDAKRRANMEARGEDEYEAFDLFQPLLFPFGRSVSLDLTEPGQPRRLRDLPTIRCADRQAKRPPEEPKGSSEPLWTATRRGSTAILTMASWAVWDSKWDWQGWLDTRFAEWTRDGVSGLVVDLRGNEGGANCGDRVLAHLTDQPLAAPPQRRLVRFREVPADLRPYLDTWDKSFFTLGAAAQPAAGGLLELGAGRGGGWSAVEPLAPRFRGKVAVIIEPMNSSATFGFAQRVRDAGLATLVGSTTGGNRQGINGGAFFFARLPESGLEFDLPLIFQTPATPQPDRGVLPDVAVMPTAADLAAGRDRVLERALAAAA